MKIAFAVWGSSVRFKNHDERWSGQSEYVAFVHYLLSLDIVTTVYMIGKHDKFYPDNPKFVPYQEGKYPKADMAYVFISQGASCISTIPGYRWAHATKELPVRRTKVLGMAENYASMVTDYLNTTNIPWVMMITDPRYVDNIKPADITNHPAIVIGSAECKMGKWNHALKYLPFKDSKNLEYKNFAGTPVQYAQLQKLNLFKPLDFVPSRRKLTRFAIVLNKIQDYDYRRKQAAIWLPKNVDLYGNLEIEGHTNKFVTSTDLDIIFSRVKYTLVMPLYDHGIGKKWLTFKPYEMIRLGVIPFIHPDYDQDNRFAVDVNAHHNFLRVANKKELEDKMMYLDERGGFRDAMLEDLQKKIVPPKKLIDYAKQIVI